MRLEALGEERGVAPLLLIAFIVVPVVELWVISQVANRIQLLPTLDPLKIDQ